MHSVETGPRPWWQRLAEGLMAACLGVMALAVFVNVVLRYGFGSGIAASEELSRLLFVWMVFIGATAAYPLGEHMAFTSLLLPLRHRQDVLSSLASPQPDLLALPGLLGQDALQRLQELASGWGGVALLLSALGFALLVWLRQRG